MREEVVGTPLLGNDKNRVIVNYLLSYLLCLSFGTKWLSNRLSKVKDKSAAKKNKQINNY